MLKQLGKYEILRTLGQGAMGEVYLAHHEAIGRDVAIKTILPSAARGEDAEARFRREATAAGKLNHPNIVTIYDFEKDGDLLYLVMEYVKGEDLEDLIQQQSMSPSQFLEVLAQICDGLSYAHRNGIVHRDIKPSNIRVIRDGKRILAKVMDFGIARTQDSSMTATGIVMGTVSYMAPEYIQTGRSTAQGDLWAVGVMLYECLAFRKPFGGDNTTTILFKIVSQVPEPIDPQDFRGISPSVRNVLDQALSKDPVTRYQTAEEFAKALRACKDPSWKGVIEPTAMVPSPGSSTELLSQAVPPPQTLTATAVMPPGPAAPTAMMPPMPPTVVLPPVPPTQVLPAPEQASRKKSGTHAGGLALAGIGLLVAGGLGAYLLFGRKTPPVDSHSQPASVTPPPPAVSPALQEPAPAVTKPAASVAKPVVTAAPVQAGPTKPQPPSTELPKAVEETPDQTLARAVSLLGTEPGQAITILRGLAASQPGDPRVQGHLLAACYRAGNAGEFERALDSAKANGLSGPQMMKAAPPFRLAMADELRAHKAKNGNNLLSLSVVAKVVN